MKGNVPPGLVLKRPLECILTGFMRSTISSGGYLADRSERHIGFIAEDVPELVATKDRKGLSPMEIATVLTRVVQKRQELIQAQQRNMREQEDVIRQLQASLSAISKKVAELERVLYQKKIEE